MSHLDEGTLHALLDGEIPSAALADVDRHLAQCGACQSRLAEARQFRDEAFGLIESLDAEPVAPAMVAERAALVSYLAAAASPRSSAPDLPAQPDPAGRPFSVPRWGRHLAMAATVILAVGIGFALGTDNREMAAPVDRVLAPAASPDPSRNQADSSIEPAAPSRAEAIAASPAIGQRAAGTTGPRRPAESTPRPSQRAPETKAAVREEVRAADVAPLKQRNDELAANAEQPKKLVDERQSAPATPAPQARLKDSASPQAAPPVSALRQRAAAQGVLAKRDSGARQLRSLDSARLARMSSANFRLEEVVVTGSSEKPARVSADSAIKALGGSIKLIDGLTADRYEQIGSTIRVVYRTAFGDLILEQWRNDNAISHRLSAPARAPADSISAWEERIR